MSSSHSRLMLDALDAYFKETGIDIAKHPFATELQDIDSPDEVLRLLVAKAKGLKDYRGGKLMDCLRFIVHVLYKPGGAVGLAASFAPAKMIFVAVHVLLEVAGTTTSGYDALIILFELLARFLKPIWILPGIPNTSLAAGVVSKIMVVVLLVLSRATKLVQRGELKSLVEKLLGSGEIGAVLQRLKRLTQDDARMATAHILEVVYGLVYNLKVAISDGESSFGGIRLALAMMQETVNNVTRVGITKLQRNQLWRAGLPPLLTRSKL